MSFSLEPPGPFQHSGDNIQASDMGGIASEIARNNPRSAGDIEYGVLPSNAGAFNHQLQQVFMAVFVPL
jgi:hypothetical protein